MLLPNTCKKIGPLKAAIKSRSSASQPRDLPINGYRNKVKNGGRAAEDIARSPHITELWPEGPGVTYLQEEATVLSRFSLSFGHSYDITQTFVGENAVSLHPKIT